MEWFLSVFGFGNTPGFPKINSILKLNKLKNSRMQEEIIMAAEICTQNGENTKLRLPVQF